MPARLHNVNVPKTQVMLDKRNAHPLSPRNKVCRARPSDTFWNMCKTGKTNFLAQGNRYRYADREVVGPRSSQVLLVLFRSLNPQFAVFWF
jgi:hypothetical protein